MNNYLIIDEFLIERVKWNGEIDWRFIASQSKQLVIYFKGLG